MGEIADMILEGAMCQGCGEILGDGDGFPVFCPACEPEAVAEKRASGGKPFVMLGQKQNKRLRWIQQITDNHSGMYPGDYFDTATRLNSQLIRHGYAQLYHPHNPVHSTRIVISERGRAYLAQLAASEKK